MAFCEQCGTHLDEGARFCINCGAKTTNSESTIVKTQNIAQKTGNQTIKPSTAKSLKKLPILAVISVLVILFFVLYSVGSGADNVQQNKGATAAQTQGNITDINLSTLLNEFSNNAARTNQLYNGKTLRVSGVVTDISEDSLSLAVSYDGYWVDSILVFFNSTEKSKVLNLNKGQRITIRGVYESGYVAAIKRAVIETN